jgi:hypothetical protein
LLAQVEIVRLNKEAFDLKQVDHFSSSSSSSTIPSVAFGKAEWATYFGDVGVEPLLPPDIGDILASPCPIYSGKTIGETHMLVLIPETIKGKPLTLKSFGNLIRRPKEGHKTQYGKCRNRVIDQHGDTKVSNSHWVLMTKDVIPNTQNKSYEEQCEVLQTLSQKAKAEYEVPRLLDATVAILMHYVSKGERLYPHDPWTYTRCQESIEGSQTAVGGFFPEGLSLYYSYFNDQYGLAGLRKLLSTTS